jgi:hypothetical protein
MCEFRCTHRQSLRPFFSAMAVVVLLLCVPARAFAGTVTVRWQFSTDDLRLEKAGEYTRLFLKDAALVPEVPGTPSLPAKHVYVVIPPGANVTGISSAATEQVVARDILVYPAQPARTTNDPPAPFVPPDVAAYASDVKLPVEAAVTQGMGTLHGYRLVSVRLNPVRYIAGKKELYLTRTIEATLTYDEDRRAAASVRLCQPRGRHEVRALVSNPQEVDLFTPQAANAGAVTSPGAAPDGPLAGGTTALYLLITNEALAPSFQPLVDRRTAQGKPGKLVTTEWIYANYDGTRPDGGTDDQTKIRNCIIDHYNHGTQWVCLAGDEAVVPVRECRPVPLEPETIVAADLYYADVDGGNWDPDADGIYGELGEVGITELIPDVFLGRIPVSTAEQAETYVSKVVTYEEASPDGFAGRVLLGEADTPGVSGEARPLDYRHHDPIGWGDYRHMTWYWNEIQPYWQAARLDALSGSRTSWDENEWGDYDFTADHLVSALNCGYHHVGIVGHGNPVTWWPEKGRGFSAADAAALTNAIPSIVRSWACETAWFHAPGDCIAEAFLHNPNGGAVAYLGYSRGTSDQSHYWQSGRDILRHSHPTIGQAFTQTMTNLAAGYAKEPYWHLVFLLLGDPAIELLQDESGRHLQILVPGGCEQYGQDADIIIRWNAAGAGFTGGEQVRLDYSADQGATWQGIPGAQARPYNSRLFIWENPSLPTGTQYRVRVTSLAEPGVSDASRRNFAIAPLRLLTVRSTPQPGLSITGTKPNTTDYTFTMIPGESVTLTAPLAAGYNFARWTDANGNTLTYRMTFSFIAAGNKTVVAEYQPVGAPRDYYVNDEMAEDGFAAGDDNNDGLASATPVRHIQEALNRCGGLGTIHVSRGTYAENIVMAAAHAGLTLAGADANTTILDGSLQGSCLAARNVQNLCVRGLTFRNGKAYVGAGVYLYKTVAEIRDCRMVDNQADDGSGSGWGGGLYVEEGSAVVDDTVFSRNSARYAGGGLSGWYTNLVVSRCDFRWNQAAWFGGAISCDGDSQDEIDSSRFLGNSAGLWGGAVDLDYSSGVVSNTVMSGNKAWGGGGMAARHAPSDRKVSLMRGCTVSGNAASQGGGVWAVDDSLLSVSNSILWGNVATQGADLRAASTAQVSVSFCDVPLTTPGFEADPTASVTWGQGNTSLVPRFVRGASDGGDGWGDNPATPTVDEGANDDYGNLHLLADSPCISAGDPAYVPAEGETDVDGQPRRMGAGGDVGSDEYSLAGDADGDGYADVADLLCLAASWGKSRGDPDYDPRCDFNSDGPIDVSDLLILAENWGT